MGKCFSCCFHLPEAAAINQSQQKSLHLEIGSPTEALRIQPLLHQPSPSLQGPQLPQPSGLMCVQDYVKSFREKSSHGLDPSLGDKCDKNPASATGSVSQSVKASSKRHSHPLEREVSETKISQLFHRYKDKGEDVILSDGIETFCHDLDVRPEEFRVLVLAWKFNASQMCQFTRQEFTSGCRCLRADSVNSIKARFPDLLEEIQQVRDSFKDLYRFTFRFGLEPGQRVLALDMAVQLWGLVFSLRPPPILASWLRFLEKHPHVRGIPRDTWNMFLNFGEAVGNDLSNYDDTEAWPCLFDDFVEYENDQTNQNVRLCQDRERADPN